MTAAARVHAAEVDGLAVTRRPASAPQPRVPTVVLVHGAMDRAASFGRVMRRLAGLDVVAYDRRGYAGSLDAGVADGIAEHAADLGRVIDWVDTDEVVVIGHSLGGTVAAALAVAGESRLVALGMFESPFPVLDDSFEAVGGGAVQLGREQGPAAGAEHFYRLMVGEHTWSRLRERDRAARRAEGPALLAELADLRRRERALDPADIVQPVLVGRGGLSSQRMRTGARLLAERLPAGTLEELARADHGAHLARPDDFARYVGDVVALCGSAPGQSPHR